MLRRAVFSDYQRKGLEKRFQVQKYISKPDRKKLAEKLGLKDSQVSDQQSNNCHMSHLCHIYVTVFAILFNDVRFPEQNNTIKQCFVLERLREITWKRESESN